MRNHEHVSDHELVLALDGELSHRRQAAVSAHLVECASCRTRREGLARAAALSRVVYRSETLDADHLEASRENLRRKLAMMRDRPASFVDRLTSTFLRTPRWTLMSAALIATVLLVEVGPQFGSWFLSGNGSPYKDSLPIAALTPGATWNISVDEICAPSEREKRQVSEAVRTAVLRAYRMERVPADQYELDFLITPELGGAPTPENLWPERYGSRTWNAQVKDQLERLLPKLVCDGRISLQTAQQDIAADWIAAYKKYFRTDVPLTARLGPGRSPSPAEGALTYAVSRDRHTRAQRILTSPAPIVVVPGAWPLLPSAQLPT